MSGAGFILAIGLAVAALLATAFAALASYDRARRAAWWFAASYAAIGLSLAIEFLAVAVGFGSAGAVAMGGGLLAANMLFNAGLAVRGGVKIPWAAMSALLAASLLCGALAQNWPEGSMPREAARQLPYALMFGGGIAILLRSPVRSRLDTAFAVLMGAATAQFVVRLALALLSQANVVPQQRGGLGLLPLSLVTVFAVALALGMLVLLVRDSLHDARGRSESDALSGLLNRAGFERQGAAAFEEARRRGLPLALVLADLDHFKAVNDAFGHAAGDRVIAAFAALLRGAPGPEARPARIGGEEFAVLLPGTALGSARLWAERARAALATTPIETLPGDRRVTASFGAAEWRPGETLAELLARADGALYAAKSAGRDCVRLSTAHRSDRWERDPPPSVRGAAATKATSHAPPKQRRFRDAPTGGRGLQ